jgi:hypothetical protein
MADVCILYRRLVYFTAFGYIVWPFGTFYGYLGYFFPFWYFVPLKIWQPCAGEAPIDTRTFPI